MKENAGDYIISI